MPICFLYPAFVMKHTERQKGIKPQGMTIVTVSSAPILASAPASALSSSLYWQTSESPQWVKPKRCPVLVGTSHMTDGAAVLLIDILLGCSVGLGP